MHGFRLGTDLSLLDSHVCSCKEAMFTMETQGHYFLLNRSLFHPELSHLCTIKSVTYMNLCELTAVEELGSVRMLQPDVDAQPP